MGGRGVIGDKWSTRVLWVCALGSVIVFCRSLFFTVCQRNARLVIGEFSSIGISKRKFILFGLWRCVLYYRTFWRRGTIECFKRDPARFGLWYVYGCSRKTITEQAKNVD
ncbi:uncharacterized protein LOC101203530 isoform X1 [Cucumis sativus]|uniref:uncharacterized protein LOC101203530 isoform X1 n=1 Tax=Cucumis sativus TaxID=3659 RepID=UPI0012F51939|nr:uncharacterized protein LOC101203530 isoform X1 [Cucumis sativus]